MTKDAKTRYFNDVSDLETCRDYLVLSGRSWKKLNLPSHLPNIKFLLNSCLLNTQYVYVSIFDYLPEIQRSFPGLSGIGS